MKEILLVVVALLAIIFIGAWVYYAWQATGVLIVSGFSSPDFAYNLGWMLRCAIVFVPISIVAGMLKD